MSFDGACFKEENMEGLGVVVRNHLGQFLAGMSKRFSSCYEPEHIETLAALVAAKFAHDAFFLEILFEGDSQYLIHSLTGRNEELANTVD